MGLPSDFNKDGLLSPADYDLTIRELKNSIFVNGPKSEAEHWDILWRRKLVDNLEILVKQLWKVGVENIFIDGSFVENKVHPNDIDGYFECEVKDFKKMIDKLNKLDPHHSWIWPNVGKPLMWHVYRVELYPHYGQFCGIDDVTGYPLKFPAAFRQSRDFKPKGIVRIIRDRR